MNEVLRELRIFSQLTQKELAEDLDYNIAHLTLLESGHRNVTLEVLDRYANFFEVPMSNILRYAEERRTDKKFSILLYARDILLLTKKEVDEFYE